MMMHMYCDDVYCLPSFIPPSTPLPECAPTRGLVVCYPRADEAAFAALARRIRPILSLPVRLVPVDTDERGLPFFYDLARADMHTDAGVIAHMDADMIMHHPLSRQDLLAPDGRPIARSSPFALHHASVLQGNKPSQDLIGFNTTHTSLGGGGTRL